MTIHPEYRGGEFVGFAVYVNGEAVGRAHRLYKHAVLLLRELQS